MSGKLFNFSMLPSGKKESNRFVSAYLELIKFHLCLYVSFSAAVGYVMAIGGTEFDLLVTVVGTFCLACGSAVLNNIQDRQFDAGFPRTDSRVLVTGEISILHAWLICLILILSGLGLFAAYNHVVSMYLGMGALACYNFLYTPMKKKTLAAIIPGVGTGMLVPAIGWSAAGGNLLDPVAFNLSVILGLWQIPHFLILQLRYGMETEQICPSGRSSSLFSLFSNREIKIQILLWTTLYNLSVWHLLLIFSLNHWVEQIVSVSTVITLAILCITMCRSSIPAMRFSFVIINLSILCFMILMVTGVP